MRKQLRTPPSNVLWASLVGAMGAACLASTLFYTRGRFLAPLDDVYIVLAYGREMLAGLPFRFNPSDPPSTGATSLLYVLLASPFSALGKNEWFPVLGLLALNGGMFWLICRQLWPIALQLMPVPVARAAILAVIVSGPVVWGMYCGLDTALATLLILAVWRTWSGIPSDRRRKWWVMPGLTALGLSLARPEGTVLVLASSALMFVSLVRQNQSQRARISLALGVVAFAVAMIAPLAITRSPMPSSGWAKTSWASPVVPAGSAVASSSRFLVDTLKGIWMGAYPGSATVGTEGSDRAENEVIYSFPPGALLLVIAGVFPLVLARPVRMLGAFMWLTSWLVVCGFVPVGWHHHRYLIPIYPIFILFAFAGIARLGEYLDESWRHQVPRLLIGAWFVFSAPGLIRHIQFYGHGAESYLWHHRLMAEQLERIPVSGAVAATDVGILRYFGSRKIIDLKALTAPWLFPAAVRGWGSLYDEFKGLPPTERPAFAALHSARPDVNAELPVRKGVMRPLFALAHPRIASEFVLHACDWGGPGLAPFMPGWTLADEVDCGSAKAELSHEYKASMASRETAPYSTIQIRRDSATREKVGDGGWVLSRGEDFTIRARAGHPLLLKMRTYAPRATVLSLSLNGGPVARVPVAAQPAAFQSILVLQAEGKLVREVNRVRVRLNWPEGQEYSSFHYWAFQPEKSD